MLLEHIEIRKIRNPGIPDHRQVDQPPLSPVKAGGQAVLILQGHLHVRHHPGHRDLAQLLQHGDPRIQDRLVPPELVDHQPLHPGPLRLGKEHQRPQKLGEHSAPVDISRQEHRRVHQLCQSHVHNVVFLQVDLRRAASPLDHDDVRQLLQLPERLLDLRDQAFFVGKILPGRHIAYHFPVDDHLGAHVGGGL